MPILEKFHFPRFHDKNLKCTRFNPYSLFIYEDGHRLVDFFLIKEGNSQLSLLFRRLKIKVIRVIWDKSE